MQHRAYSTITYKTIDSDQRIVEGIASTPSVDRMGDIVVPAGAVFELPIPFLLDHNHTQAVGEVEWAEVTNKGIRFRARIKKIDEPGAAKDLVDKAWHLIKHGLRKAVSIGFAPIEYEQLPSGGLRFTAWDWFELSAVTIPAQPDARITGTKAARSHARRGHVVKLDGVRPSTLYDIAASFSPHHRPLTGAERKTVSAIRKLILDKQHQAARRAALGIPEPTHVVTLSRGERAVSTRRPTRKVTL